jgi:RNA polymerase sigma-19 factor, ECF subfamily
MTSDSVAAAPAQQWEYLLVHRGALLRQIRRQCPSVADAEDVLHESLLRVARSSSLTSENARALLAVTARNLCIDLHRRSVATPAKHWFRNAVPKASPSAEDVACARASLDALEERLMRLPEAWRHVLVLRACGYGIDEIASTLGTTYKSAESTLARVRRAMRAALSASVA